MTALVIATVLSTIAAVVAFTADGSDDGGEQAALRDRIAELTEARADALDQVTALDADLASLEAELVSLETQLADAEAELAEADADGDVLSARITELQADIERVRQGRAEAIGRAEELTVTVADQAADLKDLRARLALVVQQRDELAARFPVGFDVSLVGVDLAGDYRVKVTDVVGTTPKFTELTITRTSQGWLTAEVPGLAAGGFTMVDGVLQMIAGSSTAAGSCDGVARQATVVMTVVPSGYAVGVDGALLSGLDAVVTTMAPATGSCGAFVATANAVLAPGA